MNKINIPINLQLTWSQSVRLTVGLEKAIQEFDHSNPTRRHLEDFMTMLDGEMARARDAMVTIENVIKDYDAFDPCQHGKLSVNWGSND